MELIFEKKIKDLWAELQTFHAEKYKVLTPSGWSNFSGIKKTERKSYLLISTENGKELKCSYEHKLKFSNGELSGSMDDNCPGGSANPGETPCKINDAKNATDELIDAILNISGNKVGLVGFESYAKTNDFHNLSNNSQTLKNVVDNIWDASGTTCICCGILKAVSCFDKKIFYDDFDGQTDGSNPSGWTLTQSGGTVDITSDSLEGDRSATVKRTGNNNPKTLHAKSIIMLLMIY
jgi:hypothetical protein